MTEDERKTHEEDLAGHLSLMERGNVGRAKAARTILVFMVGRGLWPLGTRCRVTKKLKVKVKFP